MAAVLLKAARTGDLAALQRSLERIPVDCVDEKGMSPLAWASREGHVDVVEALVSVGANVDHTIHNGDTSLCLAAWKGHVGVVQVLLAAGADANYSKPNAATALTVSADQGFAEIVQLLVVAGAAIDHADNYGDTALVSASWKGHASVVKVLLEAGADVNRAKPSSGATALIIATDRGHVDVLQLLVDAGAAVNLAKHNGDTALTLAARKGHTSIAKVLLEAGANATIQSTNGATAISAATTHGHHDIAAMLRNYDSSTAAFAAIDRGDNAAFERLVFKHINARETHDRTPLHVAASRGRLDMVQQLIDRGANVNIRDINDWSALHHAAHSGYVEIVKLLMARECRVDAMDTEGRTAVMIAASNGHIDVVCELHHHGARVTSVDNEGRSLLHHASKSTNSAALVEYLLANSKAGAEEVNARDQTELTPLHCAAQAGNAVTTTMLVEHGASVDAQNQAGETALFIASSRGNTATVTVLLTHGARTDVATTAGKTAMDLAASPEVRSVLQLYHNSQHFHKRSVAILSAVDSKPTQGEVLELVPLITSAHDLRFFVSIVSLACDGDTDADGTTTRTALLNAALSRVATSKLVYDDHACVFFKLTLEYCKSNVWLLSHDLLWLDRQAEKVNNENADWVLDLQKKVHSHSWRLDAHEQSLRCVVDGVKRVYGMVLENRQAIKAVRTSIGHVQAQVEMGKQLMSQWIKHGNQLSDHVNKLQQRLTHSESNLRKVAEGLQDFRRGYAKRLSQEAKTNKIKMVGGIVAAVAGFVFGPLLKEAFNSVVDLANPIEVFGLAYADKDIVKFLTETTTLHALVPFVERQLDKLTIPKDEFETLLREEIVLRNSELLDESARLRLSTTDIDDLIPSYKAEYVKEVELSLAAQVSGIDLLLTEIQSVVSPSAAPSTQSVAAQPRHASGSDGWPALPTSESINKQELEKQQAEAPTSAMRESRGSKTTPKVESRSPDRKWVPMNAANPKIVFIADPDVFPYHAAVRESHGQLNEFHDLVEVLVGVNDDVSASMDMQLVSSTTSRESLCAAEYAYCLGHRDVGDLLLARMVNTTNESLAHIRSTTQADSVALLEDERAFVYVHIVNECSDVAECDEMCELIECDGHAIDARIDAEVVRETREDICWTAVEYAAHLGYVDIVKDLLKAQRLLVRRRSSCSSRPRRKRGGWR